MKKLILISIAFLIAVVSFTACGEADGKENQIEEKSTGKVVNVETIKLQSSAFTEKLNVVGTLKANNKAELGHQTGGIIKEIVKDKGSYVKKDDVIIILDNDVLKANLDAAKAQYDLSEVNFKKQEMIYKDNVSSEFQYLQAKYSRDQAKATYELAMAQYEDSFIKAPFSGIVDRRYYEKGELVPPGLSIVSLVEPNNLKIEAGIPERYVGQIKQGTDVMINVKSVTSETIKGKVSFIGASVETNTRTFPVEVRFVNSGNKLKPEIVAELEINIKDHENIYLVPEEVVLRIDDSYIVFIEKDGLAHQRNVEILNRTNRKIAISGGLNEGENLVVVGYQNLVEGEKVNVIN